MLINVTICVYGKASENAKFSFDGNPNVNSKEEKILGIIIDDDLFFLLLYQKSVLKGFPKTSTVISLSKLFRTGCFGSMDVLF